MENRKAPTVRSDNKQGQKEVSTHKKYTNQSPEDLQGIFPPDFSYLQSVDGEKTPIELEAEEQEYWKNYHARNSQNSQNSQNYFSDLTPYPQNLYWEEINQLDDFEELPSIDANTIPPAIRDYCLSCAEHYQTAFEMPLFCALSCLATAVQGKYEIAIKQNYHEPLNIYALVTAEPSELKSPTLKTMKAPLEEWEEQRHISERETIEAIRSENKTLEKAIEAKRGKAGKAQDKEAIKDIAKEVIGLEKGLQEEKHYTRLLADDITPESLGQVLEQQKGKLAILEAEGGFFGTLAGRYSKGVPNLDLILKAYSCENVRIDRKGHKPIFIKKPYLTLLFLIQPYLLANREQGEAFKGRGLDARFLYFIPKSRVGYRNFENIPINELHTQTYSNMLKYFLEMPVIDNKPYILSMTDEAYKHYADFMNTLEEAMRAGGELENMRDWAGKKGHLGRLLGLLHCATHQEPQNTLIQLDEVKKACSVMTVLIAHAKRAYGMMFDNEEVQTAKKILNWIKEKGYKEFSAKESFDGIRGKIKKQDEVNQGLSFLETHSYIRKLPLAKTVGRPSIKFEVNPKFWG